MQKKQAVKQKKKGAFIAFLNRNVLKFLENSGEQHV